MTWKCDGRSTEISVPTEDPVFGEISVAGSTVTLSWTAQNLGLYSLQRKSILIDSVEWVTVINNLPGGNLPTNVPTSGDHEEFYRIISEKIGISLRGSFGRFLLNDPFSFLLLLLYIKVFPLLCSE